MVAHGSMVDDKVVEDEDKIEDSQQHDSHLHKVVAHNEENGNDDCTVIHGVLVGKDDEDGEDKDMDEDEAHGDVGVVLERSVLELVHNIHDGSDDGGAVHQTCHSDNYSYSYFRTIGVVAHYYY